MSTYQTIAEPTEPIAPRRARRDAEDARDGALALPELRKARGVRLRELAARMAVGRPAVNKLERRAGIRLNNLRRYVEALGGRLTITAHFPDGAVRIAEWGEQANRAE
jgi:transcriptional regulator with XRE-family HTH domain